MNRAIKWLVAFVFSLFGKKVHDGEEGQEHKALHFVTGIKIATCAVPARKIPACMRDVIAYMRQSDYMKSDLSEIRGRILSVFYLERDSNHLSLLGERKGGPVPYNTIYALLRGLSNRLKFCSDTPVYIPVLNKYGFIHVLCVRFNAKARPYSAVLLRNDDPTIAEGAVYCLLRRKI